ncbi:hypothetical protein JK358_24150 [Nocardia sp. 2]|uniref:PIN domain-containing protein n=1 Tax=Nocardia acididurans TaxID=2802282 RepID=A0ABS1MA50_9NOCA|nr:hypothetical protein [Nocardia acididurans]
MDDTIIHAYSHGSNVAAHLIASLAARDIRASFAAVALAVAEAELSEEQCDEISGVIDHLESLSLEPLSDAEEVFELSRIIGVMGDPQDVAAAHIIYTAKRFDWPIITVDRARWKPVAARLPWALELVELSEPGA